MKLSRKAKKNLIKVNKPGRDFVKKFDDNIIKKKIPKQFKKFL